MRSLQEVVSWQEHGKAFRVHDKKKFIDVVMPTWFSRIKYSFSSGEGGISELIAWSLHSLKSAADCLDKGTWSSSQR